MRSSPPDHEPPDHDQCGGGLREVSSAAAVPSPRPPARRARPTTSSGWGQHSPFPACRGGRAEEQRSVMTMPDLAEVRARLRSLEIETPSWAYGNSGTRFKVFPQPGVPRTPEEKIADAAMVHKFTGVAPSVALHIP